MRGGAGVVLQLLAGAVAGEQHEAAGVADHDQRVLRHVGARTRDAVGEQDERIGVARSGRSMRIAM